MSPTDHWTSDPRFSHFWTSYKVGRSWYTRHETAYWKSKAFATNYENQILKCLLAKSYQEEKSKSNIASGTNIHEGAVASSQCATLSDLDGDIEMDISDEMLEFFTLSIKHRNERRAIDLNSKNMVYINIDEIPVETRLTGISCYSNLDVCAMQEISDEKVNYYFAQYGQNAQKIQAMETAVQLNFNRNCDRKQPKLWPNMPLHL